MVGAFVRFMDSDDDLCGPINLGNPQEMSMLAIARQVIELTGSQSGIEFRPLPSDDPVQRCPDISLARSALGWEPRVSLEEGLSRTIAYFAQRVGTNPPSYRPREAQPSMGRARA